MITGYLIIRKYGCAEVTREDERHYKSLGEQQLGNQEYQSLSFVNPSRNVLVIIWCGGPQPLSREHEVKRFESDGSIHFFRGYIREGTRLWDSQDFREFSSAHPDRRLNTVDFGGGCSPC